MTTARDLYGTDVPPVMAELIVVGRLSFTLEDGALRHIRLGDTEIIRGIAFLVRDRDWGTLTPALTIASRRHSDDGFALRIKAAFESADAGLQVDICIDATPDSLIMRAEGLATGAFETNRAGFTVLHPAALAGCPVAITHADGAVDDVTFPDLIDPWQPFLDITAMTHRADGLAVSCMFEGDTFETEDQRQWGDASYKTYVRPLALPWPYALTAETPLSQSVGLTWQAADVPPAEPQHTWTPGQTVFPQTAVLVTASDATRLAANPSDLAQVAPQRLLCHIDTTTGPVAGPCAAFAALQTALPAMAYDLELVCGFAEPPFAELTAVRSAMDAVGFKPDSVMVCPSVDRQSTPPGSDWPVCPPLDEVHRASARAFDNLVRGGGMVTFFPELNRKRPPTHLLDFVSHSFCPIVHAADDLSVMETLEAIPHITRTARSIIGKADYRVGPSTIAMRHNPYGQRTIPNPGLDRVCMADDDPRHRAAFGAAYVIGLACALAPSGISVWTPAEMYGPRGLTGPLAAALSVLTSCAGQPVHKANIADGMAELIIGQQRIVANLTPAPKGELAGYAYQVSAASV